MALKNCLECGKEISVKAKTCHSCGSPQQKYNFIVGAGFYLALIGLGFVFGQLPISFAPVVGGTLVAVGGLLFLALILRKLIF